MVGVPKPEKKKAVRGEISSYKTRFIALRFAYLGWNYSGLALQTHDTDPITVEGAIINALYLCRLVQSKDPQDFKFSRCGRTDKGVSAMNQVISLEVRSKLNSEEEINDPANDSKEFDYVGMLNKLLPKDIRFKAVCLRPPKGFDARFSCSYRHYRYFFHSKGLDIEAMKAGAKRYEGDHDFRNFCKVDGSKQITNYNRTVRSANIEHVKDDLYVFDLKGTAFLWHQVRCMMAILFLIGGKHEEVSAIDYLLDVTNTTQRPIYDMAHDVPLVLYDCVYPEGLEWKEIETQDKTVYATWWDSYLKHYLTEMLVEPHLLKPLNPERNTEIVVGSGVTRKAKKYLPLKDRLKMATVEEQNAKFRAKKRKLEEPSS